MNFFFFFFFLFTNCRNESFDVDRSRATLKKKKNKKKKKKKQKKKKKNFLARSVSTFEASLGFEQSTAASESGVLDVTKVTVQERVLKKKTD